MDAACGLDGAAFALASHELDPFTRKITAKMGRGELTRDQALGAIITRYWSDAPDVLHDKLGIRPRH
jgi:hypothetical protein